MFLVYVYGYLVYVLNMILSRKKTDSRKSDHLTLERTEISNELGVEKVPS